MNVAAAISVVSLSEERVIRTAAAFAEQQRAPLFVISIVAALPYGASNEEEWRRVQHNLEVIEAEGATAVMQEGTDVAASLISVSRLFGIATLFIQSGQARLFGRSTAERLLYLAPPFDLAVIPPA